MPSNEQKAQQFIKEAKKKLSVSKGFFGFLFGSATKIDDAVECYQRAANLFKISKKWTEAGNAFSEAASLYSKTGCRHEAASGYVDAANCYKKTDVNEALNCFLKAIELYTDMGRFTMAARYHQTIAEMYENDAINLQCAVEHYNQASEYFRCEDSNSSATKCLLKVAQYEAQYENYQKAIAIYEEVARLCLESTLLKYSAKEYLFRAALCHLCVDLLNAQHAFARYIEIYPAFQDSREYKFLQQLAEHLEDQNVDGFTNAVQKYDSIARLDPWYTTILLRIKKQIDESVDLR